MADPGLEARRRTVSLATAIYCAITVIVIVGVVVLPFLVAWVDDIHPRNITRALAAWETEYGDDVRTRGEAKSRIDIMGYARDYYRYEDMPDYRGKKTVEALAAQRAKTLKTMADALRRFSGEDYGDDPEKWQAWLNKAQPADER